MESVDQMAFFDKGTILPLRTRVKTWLSFGKKILDEKREHPKGRHKDVVPT